MKKIFCGLLIMFMMCLCSCSTNNQKNTSGKIDCYSIKVTDGGSTAFNRTYSASTSKVYEYKSESGDSIYINTRMYGTDYQGNTLDYKIFVYSDRYTSDYVEYSYYGFIGWLTVEQNYYLDLDNRTIDSETKYREYLYSTNPETAEADNKKAYNCAKNNYYVLTTSYYPQNLMLRLDLEEKGLERHSYTKLGDGSIVDYRVKWF